MNAQTAYQQLLDYGHHKSWCMMNRIVVTRDDGPEKGARCTCGFSAALEQDRQAAEREAQSQPDAA